VLVPITRWLLRNVRLNTGLCNDSLVNPQYDDSWLVWRDKNPLRRGDRVGHVSLGMAGLEQQQRGRRRLPAAGLGERGQRLAHANDRSPERHTGEDTDWIMVAW